MGNKSSKPGLKNGVGRKKGSGSGTGPSPVVLFYVFCEEKTIVLKIENFSKFLTLSNSELARNGITFDAGTCLLQDGTKAPATWKYDLKHTKKNGKNWVGGFLNLHDLNGSRAKSAQALYSVSMSSGGKEVYSFTTRRNEYANSSGWGLSKMMKKSEFLKKTKGTNALDVVLRVKVFSSPQGFKPVLQTVPVPSSLSTPCDLTLMQLRESDVIKDLEKLLESGDGADIEVTVPKEAGGEVDETSSYTRKVHKGILIARSPVFAKMFAQDGEMVEAKEGKVVIKDLSPQGLGVVLQYIYTGKVSANWAKVPAEILNSAEKYDLGSLKQFCLDNLMSAVTTRNALALYEVAKLHSLPRAVTALEEFIHKNLKAVLNNPG